MANRQDNWSDREIVVEFMKEPTDDTYDHVVKRRFRKIRAEATQKQIIQFSQAVSKLTPNGDGSTLTDLYDHYAIDSID